MEHNPANADHLIDMFRDYRACWQRYALDIMDNLPHEANDELDRLTEIGDHILADLRALAR